MKRRRRRGRPHRLRDGLLAIAGLWPDREVAVARELTTLDPLAAHVRDELGLSDQLSARPLQAALASGLTFSAAAAVPLGAAWLAPADAITFTVVAVSILALAILGALGAKAGAAPLVPAMLRVVGWGAFAMATTALVGRLFGVSV